ncbi:VWA domain-containing protein [Streptomyces sp. NBC_00443]|uniref:VWA domain-containing protein n=1 Tax=Streptomyces sp. NBC_00443 TaxID=2975743 RepID=UPI002E21A884
MGILTLLRNAFGRSRKERTTEAEGATPSPEPQPTVPSPSRPATAQVPEPRTSEPQTPDETDDEHELVSAAFDNISVPNPAGPSEEQATDETAKPTATEQPVPAKPTATEEPVTAEPTATAEPVTETPVTEEPVTAEPTATEEPVTAEPTATEQPVTAEPTATEEPVTAEPTATEQPVTAEPTATEEPVTETPVTEEPVTAEPTATEEPVAETPATAEPAAEPAEAEKPVAETPAAEEPVPAEVTEEPEAASEPVVEEPEAKAAETASEPVAAEAEPEPVSEVTPAAEEPVAAAAADGGEAPQGPLAADDEPGTGGAGGNNEAEGEAEAAPKAPTADDETATEPEGEAGTPVPTTLRTAHTTAAATLTKTNLTGTTAKLYLVLDRSASMRPYYKDGSAQALAEQTLALAAHLDPEATDPKVHVVFFSTELDGTGELTLTDHENKIDELHASLGRMGRTSYHVAVEEVIAHHTKTAPGTPALVVFQTDGAPDAKTPATHALTEAAKTHPTVFFSFVAFGDPENKAFDYLRKMKLDNTSYFLAGEDPKELTDAEIYEGILAGWRP